MTVRAARLSETAPRRDEFFPIEWPRLNWREETGRIELARFTKLEAVRFCSGADGADCDRFRRSQLQARELSACLNPPSPSDSARWPSRDRVPCRPLATLRRGVIFLSTTSRFPMLTVTERRAGSCGVRASFRIESAFRARPRVRSFRRSGPRGTSRRSLPRTRNFDDSIATRRRSR